MIYDSVTEETPIAQGDIFRSIARVEHQLNPFILSSEELVQKTTWKEVVENTEGNDTPLVGTFAVKKAWAIVISQGKRPNNC